MIPRLKRSMPKSPSNCCSGAVLSPLVAAVMLLLSAAAQGTEIPGDFTAVRPIGMGDAFTAVASDDNAVWTNPAGIGRVRKARSRSTFNVRKFPNVIAGANGQSQNFYSAFKGSQDKSVAGVLSSATTVADKPFYVRGAAFPVLLFDTSRTAPMALGVYSNTTVQALVPSQTPETAQVTAISDVGGVITFGWTTESNRFNAGLSVRPVMRYAFEDRIPSSDLISKSLMQKHLQTDANRMTGTGVDFGLIATVADFWFPTIGVAVRNLPTGCKVDYLNPYTQRLEKVCGNIYKGSVSNADALSTVDPMDLQVGLSIIPRLTRKLNLRFAVDAHHLPVGTAKQSYGLTGIDASKLVHAGIELYPGNPLLKPMIAGRAGYSQGFATAGASLNLGFLSIEVATYGVDVSATSKPVEDRRVLGSLTLDL